MMYAQHIQAPKEVRVSKLARPTHRWLSIIFTVTVIANVIAVALGKESGWIVYLPLPPLFLLLLTGLYLFALPYLASAMTRKRFRSQPSGL